MMLSVRCTRQAASTNQPCVTSNFWCNASLAAGCRWAGFEVSSLMQFCVLGGNSHQHLSAAKPLCDDVLNLFATGTGLDR